MYRKMKGGAIRMVTTAALIAAAVAGGGLVFGLIGSRKK